MLDSARRTDKTKNRRAEPMANIVKLNLGDQTVDAREEDFEIKSEDWNVYELADGGRVKVKTVVAKIFRVLDADGKPALDPAGEPFVVVRHNIQVSASI